MSAGSPHASMTSLPLSCEHVISSAIVGHKRVFSSSSSPQSLPIGSLRVFRSRGSPPLERTSLRPPRDAGDIPHIPGLAAGPQAVGTLGILADPLAPHGPREERLQRLKPCARVQPHAVDKTATCEAVFHHCSGCFVCFCSLGVTWFGSPLLIPGLCFYWGNYSIFYGPWPHVWRGEIPPASPRSDWKRLKEQDYFG